MAEVASLLSVTPGSAALLLRSFRWNQEDLLTRYMEDPDAVSRAAGVVPPSAAGSGHALSSAKPGGGAPAECAICREELRAARMRVSALHCGHAFCDGCWSRYLELKVADGDTAIRCPGDGCALRVPEETVVRLCSPDVAARYKFFMRKSFVEDSRSAVWCPVAGCSLAVDTGGAGGGASCGGVFLTCSAGHAFCALCNGEAHAPASCETVKAWLKKCDDDSETFNWLSVNTQDCPNCKSTIEKNGGCNHMTCKKCKAEFCWVCLGEWSKHTDFYSCNKFDPEAAKAKDANKASSRAALDRYIFHFHRYINHDASAKKEGATRARAEAKMRALQEAAPAAARGWGDVAFVQAGAEEAIRCRSLLKWTYVLAFSLTDGSPEKELFCFLQQDLESRTERLSGLLEAEPETLLQPAVRAEILALVAVAAAARKKLLKGVEERGLAEAVATAAAAAAAAEPPAAEDAGASGSGARAAAPVAAVA